jgi:hypothetical protein
MLFKIDFISLCKINSLWVRYLFVFATLILLNACAHPITINPDPTQQRLESRSFSTKIAGYVMTDLDRAKQVTTEGGGGDKISYFPYRDLEKGIRDVLKALYSDVVVVRSPSDFEAFKRDGVGIVFAPEIYTTSNSDSLFTWPPTQFSVDLSSTVTDTNGNMLARLRVVGQGFASFSEFKGDFGLAGKRAAHDALEKMATEIRGNPRLQ